jgi:hypothetical protein
MRRVPVAAALLALAAAACSPTFNWREVRAEPASLKVLLPCKPDKGSRRVPLGGSEVELAVLGCDTGGATFAVLQADVGAASRVPEVLEQWHRATLLNLRASPSPGQPFTPVGATAVRGAQRFSAQGQRADGSPVRGEIAYFARGSQVFQAVVYATAPQAEWVQPFFEGLKFE